MIYIIHSGGTQHGNVRYGSALHHVQHYVGFCTESNFSLQIARHKAGKGAKILAARRAAGIGWQVVRVLKGNRQEEQNIIDDHKIAHLCSVCEDVFSSNLPTSGNYYERTEISNSDLSIYKHVLMGVPYVIPQTSVRLGQAVHELILEPDIFSANVYSDVNTWLVERLVNRFLSHTECQKLLENAQLEQPIYSTDQITGIPIRCKADILHKDLLVDIKTTRASSESAFLKSCQQYEYDRQMAFYLDAFGRRKVLIVGISKTADKLFFLPYRSDSDFIRKGRKKYRYLLDRLASDQKGFNYIYAIRQVYADSLQFDKCT